VDLPILLQQALRILMVYTHQPTVFPFKTFKKGSLFLFLPFQQQHQYSPAQP
jgi:hypothetical protein